MRTWLALLALIAATTVARAEDLPRFAIHVHVPDGLVDQAWLDAQVAMANQQFAAAGASFEITARDTSSVARVDDRAQRAALKRYVTGKTIHVFVTGRLADVDEAGAEIRGVTLKKGSRKYIILSAIAMDRVLAHELGHLFGLPHSTYPISIMNKTKRDTPPMAERRFSDEELALLTPAAKRFVRTKRYVTR